MSDKRNEFSTEFKVWFWVAAVILAANIAWCSRPANAWATSIYYEPPKCLNTAKITDYLVGMPPSVFDRDETPEARRERLAPVAEELSCNARNIREVAFALTQGWIESKFDADVMAGKCNRFQCDPDKKSGKKLAKGAWQAQQAPNRWRDLWAIADSDVRASVRLQLEMQRAMSCKGNVIHSFAAHGGANAEGVSCRETPSAVGRAKFYKKVLAKL